MATKKKSIIKVIDGQPDSLSHAVTVIKRCEQSVVSCWQEMAMAVKAIHSKKLWQDGHNSFEECMAKEVGWKKSWAYEMLKAADVLEDAPITDASMARYLHKLDGNKRLIAWEGAVNMASPEKPTRDDVKKAASILVEAVDSNCPDVALLQDDQPEQVDANDHSAVPDASDFERIITLLREAKGMIEKLAETETGQYITTAQITIDLKNVFNALQWAKPHCTCVYCEGEGCKHCQHTGWLCKGLFNAAPDEVKTKS